MPDETTVLPVETVIPKVPETVEPTIQPETPEGPVTQTGGESSVVLPEVKPVAPMTPKMLREAAAIENLEYRFKNHEPKEGKYTELRHLGLFFTQSLLKIIPDGRERAKALENAELAIMWAEKGIDINDPN